LYERSCDKFHAMLEHADAADLLLEHDDPDCIDPTEASELLRGAPWRRLLVVGDSVAEGIHEPLAGYRDTSFSDRVAAILAADRPGFAYLNLGRRDLLLDEIRRTQLAPGLDFEPDLAIVAAGGNDALRRSFDDDVAHARLTAIVAPLAERAQVVTIGLFDLPRSGLAPAGIAPGAIDRFDRLDAVTAAVAAEHGAVHVDTHHHPRAADPAIFSSDLIHANARGHAIAAAAIVRVLSRTTAAMAC
jgi:lysophospholipase L1-like esterase